MQKVLVIADTREEFENFLPSSEKVYNDHISRKALQDNIECLNCLGFEALHWGGVKKLIRALELGEDYRGKFFLNLSDGLSEEHRRSQAPVLLEMLDAH